jgi:hypothetical protein
MTENTKQQFSEAKGEGMLWLGFLLPPVVWSVQLEAVYLLSGYGCSTGDFNPIHLISIIALALSITGGLISFRNWRVAGGSWKSAEAGSLSRSRFLAILGMLNGTLLTLVIFAQWLPTLTGVPCDK